MLRTLSQYNRVTLRQSKEGGERGEAQRSHVYWMGIGDVERDGGRHLILPARVENEARVSEEGRFYSD